MKKRVAIALAAVMAMGSLVGCVGSGTTATISETKTKVEESGVETKAEEKAENKGIDTEKTMVIGVIPKSTLFDFYKMVRQGAEDAATERG